MTLDMGKDIRNMYNTNAIITKKTAVLSVVIVAIARKIFFLYMVAAFCSKVLIQHIML
jgi:hypothetical protein